MRKASVDVQKSKGKYQVFRVTFAGKKHYDNWWNMVETKWGYKIIGVRFDDGYPGVDGFNNSQERNQKQ